MSWLIGAAVVIVIGGTIAIGMGILALVIYDVLANRWRS